MFGKNIQAAFRLPLEESYTYSVPRSLEERVKIGSRIEAVFNGRLLEGIVTGLESSYDGKIAEISRLIDDEPMLTPYQIELGHWMAETLLAGVGECLFKMFPPGRRKPGPAKKKPAAGKPGHTLNEEQSEIFRHIAGELEARAGEKTSENPAVHLVHGITGSGKTELYIHLIRSALSIGRGAILLVPEISLTVQMVKRLEDVFRGELALLHSALTGSDRFGAYISLLRGEKRIAVGTRSAVFAPVENPGLIIIDEEHDSSYKEHSAPRYDARQIARKRCRDQNAVLVLGSATPRLESRYFSLPSGGPASPSVRYHRLTRRATGARLAEIRIIKGPPSDIPISGELTGEIDINLKKREQVMLLLNRRGYIPYLYCKKCSRSIECPNCSVTLNLHQGRQLRCHYCSYTMLDDGLCNRCGEKTQRLGSGTQKLEEYLLRLFPAARLERLDTDSAAGHNVADCINRFLDRKIDILIGTQMIAKGLDAPGVTLVGVLQADQGLYMPDFRSAERTFALLMQVAGRSGRGDVQGRAVFEAINPDNEILKQAARQDYDTFFVEEIKHRKEARYPPFVRIARLLIRSFDEGESEKLAEEAAAVLREKFELSGKAEKQILLGPVRAPLYKINNQYRNHILIKTNAMNETRSALAGSLPQLRKLIKKDSHLEIDFDPVDLF